MSEVVVAPDCAQLVIDYLTPLVGAPVSSKVPEQRPDEFVRVTQLPSQGQIAPSLFRVTVVVEVWASTPPRASELARLAQAHLHAAHGAFEARCAVPGQYPTDPVSGSPKYGFTADLYVRGFVL